MFSHFNFGLPGVYQTWSKGIMFDGLQFQFERVVWLGIVD
jgi:hypothetical protein